MYLFKPCGKQQRSTPTLYFACGNKLKNDLLLFRVELFYIILFIALSRRLSIFLRFYIFGTANKNALKSSIKNPFGTTAQRKCGRQLSSKVKNKKKKKPKTKTTYACMRATNIIYIYAKLPSFL